MRTALVLGLLALYYVMAVRAVREKSPTYDEPTHLAAGHADWYYGDFRLQPENGNLPQRLGALPSLFGTPPRLPAVDDPGWAKADQYAIARQFLYGMGNDAVAIVFRGRCVMAVVGMLTGLVVFFWATRLFGFPGGIVSLVLFAFSPTMLAHGALTTSDMTVAFFFTVTVACFWWVLHRVHVWSVLAASFALGGLCIAKMSCVLVAPMIGGMFAARLASPIPLRLSWFGESPGRVRLVDGVWRRARVCLGVFAVAAAIAYGLIWGAYGFRFSAFSSDFPVSGQFSKPWSEVVATEGKMGKVGDALIWVRDRRLLPEAYVFGFAYVLEQSRSRQAFINGKYGKHGWWYYFPFCFLVKTPIPSLLLVALGLAGLAANAWRKQTAGDPPCKPVGLSSNADKGTAHEEVRPPAPDVASADAKACSPAVGRSEGSRVESLPTVRACDSDGADGLRAPRRLAEIRNRLTTSAAWRVVYPTVPLWCLLAVYWAVSVRAHLNIGHRHLLPTYPATFILAGAAACVARRRRWWLSGVGVLMLWLAAESASISPHYLAYFNQLTGGPENGYKHLVDSSLDWGQDLITLREWLREQRKPGEPVYLAYQGTADPAYYGLDVHLLPSFGIKWEPSDTESPPELRPGIYCISATRLALLFNPFCPAWKPEFEPEYRELAGGVGGETPAGIESSLPTALRGKDAARLRRRRFRQMRLAKLCTFLRRREPDAFAGYSILIYRLTEADLASVAPSALRGADERRRR